MSDALPHEATFNALGTTCAIVTTDPVALLPAVAIARAELDALDRAASRFRSDSELSRINAVAEFGELTIPISALLHDYLRAAIRAAQLTQGLVDPTVGKAIMANGYDADIEQVRGTHRDSRPPKPAAGWQELQLTSTSLHVPRGCALDLGASAKAHASDRIAAQLVRDLPGGFLVNLGGDIALAGPAPEGGWHIGVEGADGQQLQSIYTQAAGVATSSTRLRTWNTAAGPAHHIVNPRTGQVAQPVWAQVTVAARTALEANAFSTAAIVLGEAAPVWLERHGVAARLDPLQGAAHCVGGWPCEQKRAA